MLFFYVRSVLTDNFKLKRSDWWHFLPALIYFIAALPNTFIHWHDKVDAAKTLVKNGEFIMVYKATLLSYIIPEVYIFVSRLFLVLGYTLWSIAILIDFLRKKKSSRVISSQHFMKKWLFLLLAFILLLSSSQILLVFQAFKMHFSDLFFNLNIIRIISAVGLIGLLIFPFFFPPILYGMPQMPNPNNGENNNRPSNQTKDYTNNFESEYLQTIGQKSDSIMAEQKLYLETKCNLEYFSRQIDVPPHHLAYYFREIKKQRFNDFRNELRINHAKILIEEGKASEMTLEAIGLLSGFSSRITFINDFKKTEGVTPGVYASRFN